MLQPMVLDNLFLKTYTNDFQEFIKYLQGNIIMSLFEYRKQIIEKVMSLWKLTNLFH